MIRKVVILCTVLILPFSCKNKPESKISDGVKGTKSVNSDTAKFMNVSDNYLIDNTVGPEFGLVYMYCEKMPEFPGGESAFFDYVRKRVNYTSRALADKLEGRVVVKFIIKENGEAADIRIFRSLREDLDKECLSGLSKMPHWKPGMIGGKQVSVSYSVPVRFLLQKGEALNGIYILPGESK